MVSVVVLTKNRCELLSRALESISKQTYHDYEVIVVNDGSTDATENTIAAWRTRLPQLHVITHTRSMGIVSSRQDAFFAARGKYIALLDDDDVWTLQDKLSKQTAYLETHAEVVLVGGGMEAIADGLTQPVVKLRPESDADIRRTMLFRNNFFTSSVVFRRDAALAVGGFVSDGNDFAEDYDLWLRMGSVGQFYNFPEVFVRYQQSRYTASRFRGFLRKQFRLIALHKKQYPRYWLARGLLFLRLLFRG
jgi:glycosyltransferase involved in cell wall biosynthesis